MARYAILMTDDGSFERLSRDEQARVFQEHEAFHRALEAQGKYVASFRLGPREQARTARRDVRGRVMVTDGPFTEGKEIIGGLYVIEADSAEEALESAKRLRFMAGANEVRLVL